MFGGLHIYIYLYPKKFYTRMRLFGAAGDGPEGMAPEGQLSMVEAR